MDVATAEGSPSQSVERCPGAGRGGRSRRRCPVQQCGCLAFQSARSGSVTGRGASMLEAVQVATWHFEPAGFTQDGLEASSRKPNPDGGDIGTAPIAQHARSHRRLWVPASMESAHAATSTSWCMRATVAFGAQSADGEIAFAFKWVDAVTFACGEGFGHTFGNDPAFDAILCTGVRQKVVALERLRGKEGDRRCPGAPVQSAIAVAHPPKQGCVFWQSGDGLGGEGFPGLGVLVEVDIAVPLPNVGQGGVKTVDFARRPAIGWHRVELRRGLRQMAMLPRRCTQEVAWFQGERPGMEGAGIGRLW